MRVAHGVVLEEARAAAADRERPRGRHVGDLRAFVQKLEHLLHVGERLPYLAIDEAQEVERQIELD